MPDAEGTSRSEERRAALAAWRQKHEKKLAVAAKAALLLGGLALLAARTASRPDNDTESDPRPYGHGGFTNHGGGYTNCWHSGCAKKVNPMIHRNHDCCGRCQNGRDCSRASRLAYDGPGTSAHNYFATLLNPDVCNDCGEPPEAHPWEYHPIRGQRFASEHVES